jgi:metal-dependent HD superfamily phosphatase/phosphodiesterase
MSKDSSNQETPSTEAESPGTSRDGRYYEPEANHAFPDERVNEIIEFVENDEEVTTYLDAQNVNPVDRMGYNDHGSKHIEIVYNRALCLFDLLKQGGVEFNGARQQGLEEADEPVIIALGSLLHDIGHVVHRHEHAYYSIPLAADILDRILPEFYDTADSVRVKGEVLHTIVCHHKAEEPLTLEAGLVRVADALDMEQGRSRVPYESGGRGINTVSSQAIERVCLRSGSEQPVLVEIEMTNAAGVYQVDNLLKKKINHSGLKDYMRIVAVNSHESEDNIVERIEL